MASLIAQNDRQHLLFNVRLVEKSKAKRELSRKTGGVDSDDWEICWAAQVTFERDASFYLSRLGGMAGAW